MAVFFMGAERPDFQAFRNKTSVKTDGRHRSFARRGLVCGGGPAMENVIEATFSKPTDRFWFSSWVHVDTSGGMPTDNRTFMAFTTETNERLLIQIDPYRRILVCRETSGHIYPIAETLMAAFLEPGLMKLDIRVANDIGVRIFIDRAEVLRFDGALCLSNFLTGVALSSINEEEGHETVWSEVMVLSRDTRTLTLQTHPVVSTDPDNDWSGDHGDLAEEDDGRFIVANAPGMEAVFGVLPPLIDEARVEAVKVAVRAARGEDGPTELQIGIDDEVMDGVSADGGWKHASEVWERRPTGERIGVDELKLKLRT
jgi:hypothetical protein